MFPLTKPLFPHWTRRKSPRRTKVVVKSDPDPVRLIKVVSVPIPFRDSTTAPSRFTGVEDFSRLTVSANPIGTANYSPDRENETMNMGTAKNILYPSSITGQMNIARYSIRYPTSEFSSIVPNPAESAAPESQNDGGHQKHYHDRSSSVAEDGKQIEFTYQNKYAMTKLSKKSTSPSHIAAGVESLCGTKTMDDDDEDYGLSQLSFCSDIEKGVYQVLPEKTQKERELMIKLCNEALERRQANLEYYRSLVGKQRKKYQDIVDKYDPGMNNSELEQLMLTMATQRQELLDKHKPPPATCWHALKYENDGSHLLPVYCLEGKTYLGKPFDHPRQPHTFAHLSSLKYPSNDPPGYLRYSKLVNMEGYENNEILIHTRGNKMRFDGFTLHQKPTLDPSEYAKPTTIQLKRRSSVITLPKGVYPERLSIGRSAKGTLVVQEPWTF